MRTRIEGVDVTLPPRDAGLPAGAGSVQGCALPFWAAGFGLVQGCQRRAISPRDTGYRAAPSSPRSSR
jgi:hypothetical protein